MSAPRDQPDYATPTLLTSSERLYNTKTVNHLNEVDMANLNGTGETGYLFFSDGGGPKSEDTGLRVYTDGELAFAWSFYNLGIYGYNKTTSKLNLMNYAENGACSAHTTLKFSFVHNLRVTMQAADATGRVFMIEGLVNLIRY